MSALNTMVLESLARQEAWLATLSPDQQAAVRVQMALLEMAIADQE